MRVKTNPPSHVVVHAQGFARMTENAATVKFC